jgi:formylmethanofuran dehydrogenase subunit E
MIETENIGYVKSSFSEKADPFIMRAEESKIIIDKKYSQALYDIESNEHLEVIFYFHKNSQNSDELQLKVTNYFGEEKGIFACRTPFRPSRLGLATVKLIKREENILTVTGLDAIDGTPVLDIKPYMSDLFEKEYSPVELNPRKRFIPLIKNNDLEKLLIESAALHGHYCPGLSMGVIGSAYALRQLNVYSDGLEDLLAIAEINNCMVDGIQMVTGCSIANNSLIYRDLGKSSFSLVTREGKGLRLTVRADFREKFGKEFPLFQKYFQKVVKEKSRDKEDLLIFKTESKKASFELLKWDTDSIFTKKEVEHSIPEYAKIKESVTCAQCGEQIMAGKEIEKESSSFCRECAKEELHQLDGSGISTFCY